MKKFTLYFIFIICLFFLCGCNDNTKDNTSSDAEKTSYVTNSPEPKKEIEISTFTTKILDQTSNRVNNIKLTCDKINGTLVKNDEIFSFCNTVGEVNASTGYKEADVLDAEGKPFKGYGGGNCQVSSTLYNAILEIENIEVVERHSHSKRVYYVEKDKDAAIVSGSNLDFKFKNCTGNDIKIYASSTDKEVTVKIMSLE